MKNLENLKLREDEKSETLFSIHFWLFCSVTRFILLGNIVMCEIETPVCLWNQGESRE